MADSVTRPNLDWWHKREIERSLANKLHEAHSVRLQSQAQLRDALDAIPRGVAPPDSNLLVKQACAAAKAAQDEYAAALAQWKNFVVHGVVPNDMDA